MKPLGLKPYKNESAKHRVSGAERAKGGTPWWEGEVHPSKAKERELVRREIREAAKDTPCENKGSTQGVVSAGSTYFHRKETCNKCGGRTEMKVLDSENDVVYQCDTKCKICGFEDFWAHGFFQSMQDGYDKCEKYEGPQKIFRL